MGTTTQRKHQEHTLNAALPAHPVAPAHDDHGLERLIFFSDAVFAIAITLLALELRLPAAIEIQSNAALLEALLSIWPKYLSYVISFLVIGLQWMAHHRMFRSIVRYDTRLLFLNILLLLSIGFVPFPTAIIGEYSNAVATILYALTIALNGFFSALVWGYATGAGGGRLLAYRLSRREVWSSRLRTLIAPVIFLASIGIALWNADLARFSWILIAPALLLQHSN